MSWQYTPYAPVLLVTAAVAATIAVYCWRRPGVPGARMGALFMGAVSLWSAAYAVELGATGLAAHLFWTRVMYPGIVAVPLAWLGFTAAYTGRGVSWVTGRRLALLAVPPLLTLLLVFTNGWHALIWTETVLEPEGTFFALHVTYGPAFWAWLAYAYALLLAGTGLVVSMLVHSERLYSRQGVALLFGAAAPWAANALHVFGASPVPGLDLTPFALLLTGLSITWAVSRYGLLDVVPVARAAVVEEMADALIVLDDRDRVLDLNAAARRLARVPAAEAVGRPVGEAFSGERLLRALRDGKAGGQARVAEEGRHYEVTISRLSERRREIRLVTVRDVTERVERELLFRLLVENASDIVQVYEPDASLRYVSPSIGRILGYGPAEALKLGNDRGIFHPDEVGRVLERFEQIWATPGVNPPLALRIRHKDGSWRHVEGVLNNLLDDPEVRGVVAVWRDVTERIEAEREVKHLNATLEHRIVARTAALEKTLAELTRSEERYRAIFENAVEGIFQADAGHRLIAANPALARILGYASPKELLSATPNVLEGLYADPARRAEVAERLARDGSVANADAHLLRRDGDEAWVSVSARTVYDENGEPAGYEGTVRDVTERAQRRRTLERRLAALTGIAASLAVDRPLEATLDSLAAGVVETTAALACSVYLVDPEAKALLAAGLCGLPEGYTEAVRASWRTGAPSSVLRSMSSGEPLLVRDGRARILESPHYARIHPSVREAPWGAVYIIPLVARGEALGTINAYYPPGEGPEEDDRAFLQAVADQATVVVENSRLYSAALDRAALEERQRLSRELHDSVSQALYGVALGARTARTLLDRDPARAAEPLDYVLSLAEAGLAEMRALIFELRPEALEAEGLVVALEKRAAALRARHGISVRAALCEEPDLPSEVKEALYRIAQEATHNTVKHSGAANMGLSLTRVPDAVVLEVSDDGAGFDPSGAFPGHLGLRSMRERAERLGGTVEVESAPGGGARIRVRMPF